MALREVLRDHGDELRTELLVEVIEAAIDCAAASSSLSPFSAVERVGMPETPFSVMCWKGRQR
ncbi:MAG: hypothetical protein KY469_21375 [Actinobacteria bacterium]|nr:hypothetical protein [Actinomycetota bacterium]